MPETAFAIVATAAIAWDCWRRWLAHREADDAERLDELETRQDALEAQVDEYTEETRTDIRRLRDQMNGVQMKLGGRARS